MQIKEGVKINGLKPEMLLGVIIIQSIFQQWKKEFVLTSVTDGTHKEGSKHYEGQAVDIRIWDFTSEELESFAKDLRDALGDDFDIVIEKDHIHAEYDTK